MGLYTNLPNTKEKPIQQDIDTIKKIIVSSINPISIILFGGFGRKEGSYEIINKKVIPLNDYDLYVVTKEKIPDSILDKVAMKCSKAINKGGLEFAESPLEVYDKNKYFHVDIRCLKYSELKKLKRINRTFELKHGSAIIYGEDVRHKIRDITLPKSEAFRYLINPAGQLILGLDTRRFKGNFRKDEEIILLHFLIKTYLSCASSMLILKGKFYSSYTETANAFKKFYGKQYPQLAKRIEKAKELKLNPPPKKINLKKYWLEAREDLLFALFYYAKQQHNIQTKDVKELTKQLYKKLPYTYFTPYLPLGSLSAFAFPLQYALNILYYKRTHYFKSLLSWKDIGIKISLASFLLLFAIDDSSLLDEAAKYIKDFAPIRSNDWEDLRTAILYAYDKYFSQRLI